MYSIDEGMYKVILPPEGSLLWPFPPVQVQIYGRDETDYQLSVEKTTVNKYFKRLDFN